MTLTLLKLPDIRVIKSYCSTFKNRCCYSANDPYYSGHYETLDECLEAADKVKAKFKCS